MLTTATELETDNKPTVSASLISNEEWEKLQVSRYEKEFTVELNMTAAHDGMQIGAELGCRSDHDPLIVLKLRDVGLVEDWNLAHPDEAVQVGDEFVKVGDMTWNRHSDLFMHHLKEQFLVLREQDPGITNILELGFKRPRRSTLPLESLEPEAATDIQPQSLLRADNQVVRTSEEEELIASSEEEVLLDGDLLFGFLTNSSTPSQLTA